MFWLALMISVCTCGARRSTTCATSGRPPSSTNPLSTLPIRRPWPPASTIPVMSARESVIRGPDASFVAAESRRTGEQQVMAIGRAADHRHADLLRNLVAHLRESRARHEKRDAHLRGLDHHLGREAPRRVEDLVVAFLTVEPHLSGDRVDGVVAPDVLDELQDFRM